MPTNKKVVEVLANSPGANFDRKTAEEIVVVLINSGHVVPDTQTDAELFVEKASIWVTRNSSRLCTPLQLFQNAITWDVVDWETVTKTAIKDVKSFETILKALKWMAMDAKVNPLTLKN